MITFFRRMFPKVMEGVVFVIKKLTVLATFFSFPVLFVLFFLFLIRGEVFEAVTCLGAIYAFIHLNKSL